MTDIISGDSSTSEQADTTEQTGQRASMPIPAISIKRFQFPRIPHIKGTMEAIKQAAGKDNISVFSETDEQEEHITDGTMEANQPVSLKKNVIDQSDKLASEVSVDPEDSEMFLTEEVIQSSVAEEHMKDEPEEIGRSAAYEVNDVQAENLLSEVSFVPEASELFPIEETVQESVTEEYTSDESEDMKQSADCEVNTSEQTEELTSELSTIHSVSETFLTEETIQESVTEEHGTDETEGLQFPAVSDPDMVAQVRITSEVPVPSDVSGRFSVEKGTGKNNQEHSSASMSSHSDLPLPPLYLKKTQKINQVLNTSEENQTASSESKRDISKRQKSDDNRTVLSYIRDFYFEDTEEKTLPTDMQRREKPTCKRALHSGNISAAPRKKKSSAVMQNRLLYVIIFLLSLVIVLGTAISVIVIRSLQQNQNPLQQVELTQENRTIPETEPLAQNSVFEPITETWTESQSTKVSESIGQYPGGLDDDGPGGVVIPAYLNDLGYGTVYSSDGFLNLRSDPSLSDNIIIEIPSGTSVYAYECGNNDWYYVAYGSFEGYVKRSYVTLESANQHTIESQPVQTQDTSRNDWRASYEQQLHEVYMMLCAQDDFAADDGWYYALQDINGDTIPELFVAYGELDFHEYVYGYSDGKWVYMGQSMSTRTTYFIPSMQAIMYVVSHSGRSEYTIYQMNGNGKNATLVEIDRYSWEIENAYEDNSPQWWYHNGQRVTESEYNSEVSYYLNMNKYEISYSYYSH